ncbi:MAG: hypothetical protein GF329_14340 [Candidatus Lokiarchaeota archaeon]|nr:hypothetical protein [Candidatus Lokiarchaeota archaeon]
MVITAAIRRSVPNSSQINKPFFEITPIPAAIPACFKLSTPHGSRFSIDNGT